MSLFSCSCDRWVEQYNLIHWEIEGYLSVRIQNALPTKNIIMSTTPMFI